MKVIEAMARAMCKVEGVDPDMRVFRGVPLEVGFGRVKSIEGFEVTEAWRSYRDLAGAAYEAMRSAVINVEE